jgi:hypothetical protein
MFLLCKAQNPRIMNYLRTFCNDAEMEQNVEIGEFYFDIFTYKGILIISLTLILHETVSCSRHIVCLSRHPER